MSVIRVSHPTKKVEGKIRLDGSKSVSNRALIIQALCKEPFILKRLSTSDDTATLQSLLSEQHKVYDAHHAGTTFRFMTAYLAIQEGTQVLTGSERMKQRPIGPLVTALIDLGADITYLENKGYPPLQLGGFDKDNYNDKITIKADISSQYITALILIAPVLPNGLEITLDGELVSEPYLNMTLNMISEFGIDYKRDAGVITIAHQDYTGKDYVIEADWSASSYHFSIAALADESEIILEGLFAKSIQGDSKMKDIAALFGISSEFLEDDALIVKNDKKPERSIYYDFINQPDLAQTVAVMCAGLDIKGQFTGLKTLKIKETQRINAIQKELEKIGSTMALSHIEDDQEYYAVEQKVNFVSIPRFATYKDHRMAMAFAPLALLHPIEVEQPEVVSKSYPNFWRDLEDLGFVIERIS